jgi:hypothetical protein
MRLKQPLFGTTTGASRATKSLGGGFVQNRYTEKSKCRQGADWWMLDAPSQDLQCIQLSQYVHRGMEHRCCHTSIDWSTGLHLPIPNHAWIIWCELGLSLAFHGKQIWSAQAQPTCKLSFWLALHRKLMRADMLTIKIWPHDPIRPLGVPETANHLFKGCPLNSTV